MVNGIVIVSLNIIRLKNVIFREPKESASKTWILFESARKFLLMSNV